MIPEQEKETGLKKWVRRLFKLSIFFCVLVAVFVTILANMGGSSQNLKESTENFISQLFGGRRAHVETLNRLSFFPRVGIDLEKAQVTDAAAVSGEDSNIVAVLSKAKMSMDFWDVLFGNARFRTFFVEDGYFRKGVAGVKDLRIERAYVDHDMQAQTAKIIAKGQYGKDDWDLSIGTGVFGFAGQYKYDLEAATPLVLDLGGLHVAGVLDRTADNFMKMEGLEIQHADQAVSGDVYASLIGPGLLKFRGNLSPSQKGEAADKAIVFDVLMDFNAKPLKISGDVTAKNMGLDDFWGEKSIKTILDAIYAILRNAEMKQSKAQDFVDFIKGWDFDLNVGLEQVSVDEFGTLNLTMTVEQQGGNLVLRSIKGQESSVIFDIPALAVVSEKADANKDPKFYILSSLEMKSDHLNSDEKSSFFTPVVKPGKTLDCLASVFKITDDGIVFDPLLLKAEGSISQGSAFYSFDKDDLQKTKRTRADSIKVKADDFTRISTAFQSYNQKGCLSLFASGTP